MEIADTPGNQTYEKTLLNQTNFAETLPAAIRNQAKPKDRTIVEYALKVASKPVGVATYRMVTAPSTGAPVPVASPGRYR